MIHYPDNVNIISNYKLFYNITYYIIYYAGADPGADNMI